MRGRTQETLPGDATTLIAQTHSLMRQPTLAYGTAPNGGVQSLRKRV